MYDAKGNLKPGYTNERSVSYLLIDVRTRQVVRAALRTPNEAADLNAELRESVYRWLPFSN